MTTLERGDLYHSLYDKFCTRWKLIRDVVSGKEDIDLAAETYLPRPIGREDDEYEAYQTRAVLYNATARTLDGYLGAIFRKEMEIDLPPEINYMLKDMDGQGNTNTQFTKRVTKDVISHGRFGLLVDYPQAQHIQTLAEEREADLRPHIQGYCAESIVNWATARRGARHRLIAVLIEEDFEGVSNHVLGRGTVKKRRLLELDGDGFYVIKILEEQEVKDPVSDKTKVVFGEVERIEPRLPGGERLNFIPFVFVGAVDATPAPDDPPLYDLAQLNLAHYRNSADLEEAGFMIGQPTPWISGLSDSFIEENAGQLRIGSRAAWLLPEGSAVGLLESKSEKNLILKLLEKKEEEMIGLGARIVADNTSRGSESEESVKLRRSGEASLLACIADNVSIGMRKVLEWASLWMGNTSPQVVFQLNTDFFSGRLSHQEITSLVAAWQSGAISHDIVLNNLRKGEVISETLSNEAVKTQLADEGPTLTMLGMDNEKPVEVSDGEDTRANRQDDT